MNFKKFPWLKTITHLGAWGSLAWLLWDLFLSDSFIVDPINKATLHTGKSALILLLLSLACTPVNTVLKWRQVLPLRRLFGLYAFMFASIHFLIFIVVDYGLDLVLLQDAFLEKRFALVGFLALIIMLPLAITSTKGWMKRLGKRWKKLHKLVYVAGLAAITHYIWLVKPGVLTPWWFAIGLAVLFILRLPPVRKLFVNFKGIKQFS